MGYLAENLVYFMAEAVDRNGKKDPSLGMKHADDFVKKTKDESISASRDARKAGMHSHGVRDTVGNRSYTDAGNKIDSHLRNTSNKTPGWHGFDDSAKGSVQRNIDNRKNANDNATCISTHAKLMHRDAKKAHNESALFNDPIWDEL